MLSEETNRMRRSDDQHQTCNNKEIADLATTVLILSCGFEYDVYRKQCTVQKKHNPKTKENLPTDIIHDEQTLGAYRANYEQPNAQLAALS